MSNPISGAGTPFKQIVVGGQETTGSSRTNNKSIHRLARSFTEKKEGRQKTTESPRTNDMSIRRFAQSVTDKKEGSSHARAGRASGSGSVTSSMRSASMPSYARQLDRIKRQKGDSTDDDDFASAVVEELFEYPDIDYSKLEPWPPAEEK